MALQCHHQTAAMLKAKIQTLVQIILMILLRASSLLVTGTVVSLLLMRHLYLDSIYDRVMLVKYCC